MKYYVKNMVCPRCIMAVEQLLKDIDIRPLEVQLGEIVLDRVMNDDELAVFRARLEELGFELLDDSRKQQIEKIKSIIISQIHHSGDDKYNFSELLAKTLHKDYSQLSKLFSATEGITIEHFVILQKTEKVKELIAYNQWSLSEIAGQLGYSSVAHLSAQFKKTTGLTPSQFKEQGIHLRKPLDALSGP